MAIKPRISKFLDFIGSNGGGGTDDHALLTNLQYDVAAHVGFQRDIHVITVGFDTNADYVCDGIDDHIQIQAAIDEAALWGFGGKKSTVKIFGDTGNRHYDIGVMLVIPKDSKVNIEGEYFPRTNQDPIRFRAGAALEAIIKIEGDTMTTGNEDLSHVFNCKWIYFDGTQVATRCIWLVNQESCHFEGNIIAGADFGIDMEYIGTVPLSTDLAGACNFKFNRFANNKTSVRAEVNTQNWWTNNWFVQTIGAPSFDTARHFDLFGCSKFHMSGNEMNAVDSETFRFGDSKKGSDIVATRDIDITGGYINAGSGKNFWVDNRKDAGSLNINIADSVVMLLGDRSKLVQESKSYKTQTLFTADTINAVGTVSIIDGGLGYTALDILTIDGLGFGDATITVNTVDGSGTITGVTVTTGGIGYILANSLLVTGGTGTGALISILTLVDSTFVSADYDTDEVFLFPNAGTINYKFYPAISAIKQITVKIISLASGVNLRSNIGETLETKSGAFTTVHIIDQANESYVYSPSADKYRLLAYHHPSMTNAYTVSNGVTDRTLDVATATASDVAQVLGTLIEDLKDFGALK